ncbi:hypothetical protein [Mycobacteroides abscessus]|uniref:DUF4352 domain-containing protein n=1 Tax=Mycobacteroides abscessus TaxID=36809 RepID=A0ABD7HW75_9MYCO|nr:hypothetical protein [Mycobacteroides abscessus]AMU73165.1 hypothetical protein A3O05_20185 [Mycobacteroides abscessus]AWG66902.1 hypothetical protein DDT46_06680 [Mycobacteroides abscessus]MBE5458512.1 hypothetical protein [Mycobacteroides abscessus]MBE5509645.1 hypothetical protein [Mycobacteroides abscessus]MBN7385909.1 hypothetical protein [Mycobacteroides abscessus subsp. abscessus]
MRRGHVIIATQTIACLLLLAGSAYLYTIVPQRTDSYAPAVVHGSAPTRVAGRNLAITVHRVFSAPEVQVKRSVSDTSIDLYRTKGRYIAIDLSYETVRMPDVIELQLMADHRNISRENFGMDKAFGQPEVGIRGTWVFDVPASTTSLKLLAIIFPDNDFRIMQGWYDSELSIAIPPEMVEQRQSLSVVQHKVVP